MFVLGNGVFFGPMRSIMFPVMRSKLGRANPYFYSVSWVAGAQQLPQEAPEIRGVVLERHAANEVSGEGGSGFWPLGAQLSFGSVSGSQSSIEGGHAQNCGEHGFFRLPVWKFRWKGPNPGTWKNGKIYLCWRAPPHFCVFGGAPGFRQRRVFETKLSRFENPFWRVRVWNKPC